MQTEKVAHEEWAKLISEAPAAAKLAHVLVAAMGADNAVVASQATLAELANTSVATIKRALAVLEAKRWLEVVRLGGKGGALAYVINDRVAWSRKREQRAALSRFSAQVIAMETEQAEQIEERAPLRRIPVLMRGEVALPSGSGMPPPSQPSLPGLEPVVYRDGDGNRWEVDHRTGELQMLIDDGT